MNGISLQLYCDHHREAGWTDIGWQVAYELRSLPSECPTARAEETMTQIEAAIMSSELEGFTLFHHHGKGWQMSVRRKGEPGWDVKIIADEQAQAILSMLKASGHPDGPITVRQGGTTAAVLEAMQASAAAREALSAAIGTWAAL